MSVLCLFPAPSSCCVLPATLLHLSTLPSGESNFENFIFLLSFPYLTLAHCYKSPWASRCCHGQHVPKLFVSSPPVRCFFSRSCYITFYLAEHFQSCRTCILLTCKSCALNLCHSGDWRHLTLCFRGAFLIFCSRKRLQGRVTQTPLESFRIWSLRCNLQVNFIQTEQITMVSLTCDWY